MNIRTYDLHIRFDGYLCSYYNISRVAVKYYIEYHRENPDYYGHDVVES